MRWQSSLYFRVRMEKAPTMTSESSSNKSPQEAWPGMDKIPQNIHVQDNRGNINVGQVKMLSDLHQRSPLLNRRRHEPSRPYTIPPFRQFPFSNPSFHVDAGTSFGTQHMEHTRILGQQAPAPLPLPAQDQEIVELNARQYDAIMHRRQPQEMPGSESKLTRNKKTGFQQPCQNRTDKRLRGEDGQFINNKQQTQIFCGKTQGGVPPASLLAEQEGSKHASIFIAPPPVPLPAQDQDIVVPDPIQYDASVWRRQPQEMPGTESKLATIHKVVHQSWQSHTDKRLRGEDGKFITNKQQTQISGGKTQAGVPPVSFSAQQASANHASIFTVKRIDQSLGKFTPERNPEIVSNSSTWAYSQEEASVKAQSTTPLVQNPLLPLTPTVIPSAASTAILDFVIPEDPNDLNLDEIEFTLTEDDFELPISNNTGFSTEEPKKTGLSATLRVGLRVLKDYLMRSQAESFVNDAWEVQRFLSSINATDLPRDTYDALCEIVSLTAMKAIYDAAKERQQMRSSLSGLCHSLANSKMLAACSFWQLQEEQKHANEHGLAMGLLRQKIAALEDELAEAQSKLFDMASSAVKHTERLRMLKEEGQKENIALEAQLNEEITRLADAQADEQILGYPARTVEAAKQKISNLLGENS
ncbi:hypothetical protein ACP4OV_010758 [Aristida adscensionis]